MVFQEQCKVKFITIGYIEWRKGQDILAEAIGQLPSDVAELSEFVIVGQNTSAMAKKIFEKISSLPNVSMLGTVSRDEVHKLLCEADMLICPSREDPMPTVCAEAMMHKTPCLLSDAIGTAAYIKNGYDGVLFESENVGMLKEKIIWAVKNRYKLKKMGNLSYKIYKDIFSEEAFEKNLLMYVEEMIGKSGR